MAFRVDAHTYRVRAIEVIRASYSPWLLQALNLNFSDCSINILSSPYNTIHMPLPLMLEVPSTNSVHVGGVCSPIGELNSSKKMLVYVI